MNNVRKIFISSVIFIIIICIFNTFILSKRTSYNTAKNLTKPRMRKRWVEKDFNHQIKASYSYFNDVEIDKLFAYTGQEIKIDYNFKFTKGKIKIVIRSPWKRELYKRVYKKDISDSINIEINIPGYYVIYLIGIETEGELYFNCKYLS